MTVLGADIDTACSTGASELAWSRESALAVGLAFGRLAAVVRGAADAKTEMT